MLAMKMLRRFGYRRIGVLIQAQADKRSYHAIQAVVGFFQQGIPAAHRVPPLLHIYGSIPGREFPAWLKTHRPDVVVCQHSMVPAWIEESGFKVPDDIGVVHFSLDDDCADWAGICARKRMIGATTVTTVVSLMQNNQIGPPQILMNTLIQGQWQAGKTLLIPKPGKARVKPLRRAPP